MNKPFRMATSLRIFVAAGSALLLSGLSIQQTGLAAAAGSGGGSRPWTLQHAPAIVSGAATAASKTRAGKQDDDLGSPLEQRKDDLRQQAISDVLSGHATIHRNAGGSESVTLPQNQALVRPGEAGTTTHAEISPATTDHVFVILVDFGNKRDPSYPDQDTDPLFPGPERFDGPAANTIPQPDRLVDDTTTWQPNFNRAYYENLYFSHQAGAKSVANYFTDQSSGQYTIDGTVSDWVRVPYNEARYGRSDGYPCTGHICTNVWALVDDAVAAWYNDQRAKGMSVAAIKAELAKYDTRDRYDYNNNGNFDEPDGYIDHFQIVHAGPDQASLSPLYGEDAIWSHRWYVNQDQIGVTGPPNAKFGGTEIGKTGLWVGDYTMQAENAPLGVFTHEYSHDLGLPDEYDGYGNDSDTGYWTLMSAGEYLGVGGSTVGNEPGPLSAWDKLQLGWLNYAVSYYGENGTFTIGAAADAGTKPQALAVVLPEKKVTYQLGKPPDGTYAWWSGRGDNLHTSMIRFLTLPKGKSASLTFKTWFDMEYSYDTATVEVNDGNGWHTLAGNVTDPTQGNVITGTSSGWLNAKFDLSAYAGDDLQLRIRYDTDESVTSLGFMMDDIKATAGTKTLFSDGAEDGDNGWIVAGFGPSTGTTDAYYPQYYLAEYRADVDQDTVLRTGPYNYGFSQTRPDFVEHYPYANGLLVWQWDTSMTDDDVSLHPCQGQALVADATPQILVAPSGGLWRARIQTYDAPFSLKPTQAFVLHDDNVPQTIHSHAGVSTFDDTKNFCRAKLPYAGVDTADSGTKIQIRSQHATTMTVRVTYAAVH